jgi:hypothetical protein
LRCVVPCTGANFTERCSLCLRRSFQYGASRDHRSFVVQFNTNLQELSKIFMSVNNTDSVDDVTLKIVWADYTVIFPFHSTLHNLWSSAEPVCCRSPTLAARVQSLVKSSGTCDGQSGTRGGCLQVLRLPLPILIPPTAPSSSIFSVSPFSACSADVPSGISLTPPHETKKEPLQLEQHSYRTDELLTQILIRDYCFLECDTKLLHIY